MFYEVEVPEKRPGTKNWTRGVGGSEGAVVLSIEGEESRVDEAFELLKCIKGEPPVTIPDRLYVKSAADHNYDPKSQLATLGGM
jgi:hypothetical protein